ncbi:MAG: hypothetical protein HKN73_03135, partial [Gemmatimonadetes bacterium]|nr:hypothetical protein [Gemmatimonadota bacterium]
MTSDDVAALDAYRSRRMQRLHQGLALYAADPQRSEVSRCLAEVAAATGADRVAVGSVDELDGAVFKAECMLDLLRSVPRREFPALPREAGMSSVPAFWEMGGSREQGGRGTGLGVSLGGDGARTWFLLADSLIARPPLAPSVVEEVLFLAGRCAGVLLHKDLGAVEASDVRDSSLTVLDDLVGREDDAEASRRIASRFVVVRALEVGAAGGPSVQLDAQAEVCAAELAALEPHDPERRIWTGVVAGLRARDLRSLARRAVELGDVCERLLHLGSAESCYEIAFELAAEGGCVSLATDAARFRGRVLRRKGRWTEAETAYGYARALALAARDHERHGQVVSGMAAIARERGNLPRTRELLMVQLEIGHRSGVDGVLAAAHHDLMALDKLGGDLEGALQHGWSAVRLYGDGQGSLEALTDLAGVLTELRSYGPAEDAYTIVVEGIEHEVYRTHALAGLAYLAALRGDRTEFERRARRVDPALEQLPEALQAELLYERGL